MITWVFRTTRRFYSALVGVVVVFLAASLSLLALRAGGPDPSAPAQAADPLVDEMSRAEAGLARDLEHAERLYGVPSRPSPTSLAVSAARAWPDLGVATVLADDAEVAAMDGPVTVVDVPTSDGEVVRVVLVSDEVDQVSWAE